MFHKGSPSVKAEIQLEFSMYKQKQAWQQILVSFFHPRTEALQ